MLESELIKTKPRTPKLQSGNDEICCLGVRGFVLISLSRLQSLNLTHARSKAFRGVFAFLKRTYLSTRSFTDARIRWFVGGHEYMCLAGPIHGFVFTLSTRSPGTPNTGVE